MSTLNDEMMLTISYHYIGYLETLTISLFTHTLMSLHIFITLQLYA